MATKITLTLDNGITVSSIVEKEEGLFPIGEFSYDGTYTLEQDSSGRSISVNMAHVRTVQYQKVEIE